MTQGDTKAAAALNRFGLGARPDDMPPADPQRWLLDQLDRFDPRIPGFAQLRNPAEAARDLRRQAMALRMEAKTAATAPGPDPADMASPAAAPAARQESPMRQMLRMQLRDHYRRAVDARVDRALATETPFAERLAGFWSNHFAVAVTTPDAMIWIADYEARAIRPHVMGRFADLLLAVERHPAMLTYLDQYRSIGPNSPLAARVAAHAPGQRVGLNENLAREAMELHTLGVRTGYSQADVTEFARALTGWSVYGTGPSGKNDPPDAGGGFEFRAALHEPGPRTIIGRTYAQAGEDQARAVLLDLAAAPATARHVSTKLARHFVADDPPPALINRMAAAFLKSGGDLPTVYRVLVGAPEAWAPIVPKFKTPWDWSVSALRGLGVRQLGTVEASGLLKQLGQPLWQPAQPSGYDDVAAAWAAPDALIRRVEMAQRFAALAGPQVDARTLAPKLLPGTLTPATAAALTQAESGPTALALLLVSPEFQRR